MTNYREQLKEIQVQSQRKQYLITLAEELESQRKDLEKKVGVLKAKKQLEQADVDKLEGRSLAAFFAGIRGNKEEKLNKERQEARAAAVKYDMTARELEAVECDLSRNREELEGLGDIDQRRDQIMTAWAQEVKAAGGPMGQTILGLEEQIAAAEAQQREIREAIAAGESALVIVESIQKSLGDAEGWGTWDMLGGGFLSTMFKHDALDEAQSKVEGLQVALRRFRNELVDVEISADLQLTLDDFTQFADYFFDGLFMDWTVQSEIGKSQARVEETKGQIQSVLEQLDVMLKTQEAAVVGLLAQRDQLLLKLETE